MTNYEKHIKQIEKIFIRFNGEKPKNAHDAALIIGVDKNDNPFFCCGGDDDLFCANCMFDPDGNHLNCIEQTEEWLNAEAEPEKKPHNPHADKKEKKEKIKVGDTVKVTAHGRERYGEIGVVRRTRSTSSGVKIYGVHFGGDKSGYAFSEHEIEKVKVKKKPRIVVYQDGNKVVAKDLVSGKYGEAICSPKDIFDFDYGAYLAVARMTVESVRAEITLSRLNDAMETLEEARAYLETMK